MDRVKADRTPGGSRASLAPARLRVRLRTGAAALATAVMALAAGACRTAEEKPRDLPLLRQHLLREAEKNFRHALRITQRLSPDPFNQAREQLVFTMIELEEYDRAEATGQDFLRQESGYLEAARTKLAEIEVDWKKALAGDPKIRGTRKEKALVDAVEEWKARIAASEQRILNLSLVLGEASLRRDRVRESIPLFKAMLELRPEHNAALRRIGQAYGMLGEHGLAATYLERAYLGMESRVRELRAAQDEEGLPGEPKEPEGIELNPGAGRGAEKDPGETEEPPETGGGGEPAGETLLPRAAPRRAPPTPEEVQARIQLLEKAMIEIAATAGILHFLAGDRQQCEAWFARAFAVSPTSAYVELKLGLSLIAEGRASAAIVNLDKFRLAVPGTAGSFLGVLLDRIERKHGIVRGGK